MKGNGQMTIGSASESLRDTVANAPLQAGKTYSFQFTGTTGEYFKIWLSNLCLTVLTFGIYSAWAKVRREQYFHNHTVLNGHSFHYTADPVKILIGRILVLAIIIVFNIAPQLSPYAAVVATATLLVLTPWLIVQALRFRCRYTRYRNISFGFSGLPLQVAKYSMLYRTLALLTVIFFPLAKHREMRYYINNLSFGTSRFNFQGGAGDFYNIYIGCTLLFGSYAVMVYPMYLFFKPSAPGFAGMSLLVLSLGGFLLAATVFNMARVLVAKTLWNNTTVSVMQVHYDIAIGRYLWIYISNFFLRLITFGLATPHCTVRLLRYKIECLSLVDRRAMGMNSFVAEKREDRNAIGDQASDLLDMDIDLGF